MKNFRQVMFAEGGDGRRRPVVRGRRGGGGGGGRGGGGEGNWVRKLKRRVHCSRSVSSLCGSLRSVSSLCYAAAHSEPLRKRLRLETRLVWNKTFGTFLYVFIYWRRRTNNQVHHLSSVYHHHCIAVCTTSTLHP